MSLSSQQTSLCPSTEDRPPVHKIHRHIFCSCDLRLDPMTFTPRLKMNVRVKKYYYTPMQVAKKKRLPPQARHSSPPQVRHPKSATSGPQPPAQQVEVCIRQLLLHLRPASAACSVALMSE